MMIELIGLLLLFCIIGFNVWYARQNGLYVYAKKHVTAYSFLVACLVVYLLFFGGLGHITKPETIQSLIDNIVSNYIVVIAFVAVYVLERFLQNRFEDKEKLRQDYFVLAEKYKGDNLISCGNITYPVVSAWVGDICLYSTNEFVVDRDKLSIKDGKKLYSLPGIIESNMLEIMKVHGTSTLYNNVNVRVVDFTGNGGRLELSTERTNYFYSMVTNRAADYDWGGSGITVRELYEPGPSLHPLQYSQLSNHLGFNGFIESSDGFIVFVKRSNDVSIGKRTYGDSIGASLKAKYALNEDGDFTVSGLINAVVHEIKDELKISKDFIETINLIQAYRDCVECGKPQLLFYSKVSQTAAEISELFNATLNSSETVEGKKSEPDHKQNLAKSEKDKQKKEQKVLVDGEKLVWLSRGDLDKLEFLENGVRFIGDKGGFFSVEGNKQKVLHDQFLPMVPSASAVIITLKEYMRV